MTVVLRDEASDELDAAFEHYRAIRTDLAADLLMQFRQGVDHILRHPAGWQALDDTYCRYRINRFPYRIVYRIDSQAGTIVIIALMNLSQLPNYWKSRNRG